MRVVVRYPIDGGLTDALSELEHNSEPTTRATPKGGSCAITLEDLLARI
jgi:hypothetical protein